MSASLHFNIKIIVNNPAQPSRSQVAMGIWDREMAALNGERPSRKHMIECLKAEGISEDMAKMLYHNIAYLHRL